MSSTYYQYRDVKVMIAHKLMNMEGWKVYGYHADNSDPMTDYFDPVTWGGVAEKNGYVLCVNVYGSAEPTPIYDYNHMEKSYKMSEDIRKKIKKLEEMTMERGASEQEEQSAKAMIKKLMEKAEKEEDNDTKKIIGMCPGHMENPPKMNWHIEKDGIIIAKGNGILKYSEIENYYRFSHCTEDMEKFNSMSREEYKKHLVDEYMWKWNDTEERARESAESHIKTMEKHSKLCKQFEDFINKLDTTCGGLLGEGDGIIYEKVTVTEYKKENKVVERDGEIKEGQCFILKSSFNYGCYKGLVYRIHKTEHSGYHAYKLNGKLTKECTGKASSNNHWFIGNDTTKFMEWVKKGAIAFCNIEEVKTPYEVEKVVKKVIKAEKPRNNDCTFEVMEDVDTRTNEKIFVVKIIESLSREKYIEVNKYMKSIGGYYSRFKHGFLFKENPSDKLNIA